MKKLMFFIYNIIIVPFIYLGFKIGTLLDNKIKTGNAGRKGQHKLIIKSLSGLDNKIKRILFHCSSVGEWEQAAPIIEGIKKSNPNIFVIVSFFSPSGYKYVKNHPDVNLKVYLPLDIYWQTKRFLKTLKPDLFIISKFDVWPNYLSAANKLKIPVVLTAA